jgi:hypothetical protein
LEFAVNTRTPLETGGLRESPLMNVIRAGGAPLRQPLDAPEVPSRKV